MQKIALSFSLVFLIGFGLGFVGKTFQFNTKISEIAQNSQAKFVATTTSPKGGFQAPSGGACGG